MIRLKLTGPPDLLALHGADGTFGWGEIRTTAIPGEPAELRLAVTSDSAEAALPTAVSPSDPSSAPPTMSPLPTAASPPTSSSAATSASFLPTAVWRSAPGDAVPGVWTVAPGGDGLWRRAPLPAADGLFALPPGGHGVLVCGAGDAAAAVARLERQGLAARAADRPTPAALGAAAVVAVLGETGAPLPAIVLAALAAGRLVVAPRAEPAFGLAPGVDHLTHGDLEELAELADAAARHPAAFAPLAALGRLAAESARASTVYGRIAADLAVSA